MPQNQKIKNAKGKIFDGITFKSTLEVGFYKILLSEGFKVKYEPFTYVIWEGYKPKIPFYDKDNKTGLLKLQSNKIIDIKYTPDFVFEYKNLIVFIEAKGYENDAFYLKKKLFRKYIETQYETGVFNKYPIYFEIYNQRQLKQAINIIKTI